jgi:hypothetical protein
MEGAPVVIHLHPIKARVDRHSRTTQLAFLLIAVSGALYLLNRDLIIFGGFR